MEEKATNKLFIGGISWDTSDAGFAAFFNRFGEVKEALIMRDRVSGRSRGFGFITFAHTTSAEKVMQERHELDLDGRKLDPKYAVSRDEIVRSTVEQRQTPSDASRRSNKLFVGGIAPETSESEFRAYFEKFGHVSDAVIMVDHISGRSRGFGFVTFESEESAESCMQNVPHTIHSKMVDCKFAVPKGNEGPMGGRGGRGGPSRGYGMGYGNYGPNSRGGGYHQTFPQGNYFPQANYGYQAAGGYAYPAYQQGGYQGYGRGSGGYSQGVPQQATDVAMTDGFGGPTFSAADSTYAAAPYDAQQYGSYMSQGSGLAQNTYGAADRGARMGHQPYQPYPTTHRR